MPKRPRRWLVVGVALVTALAGCYASHERGGPDAGGIADATIADAPVAEGECVLRAPTDVYVEPPMPAGHIDYVRLDGYEADPASLGVRFHLNTCPMRGPPCNHEVILVGIGADLGSLIEVPPSGGRGYFDWDGERTVHFNVMDTRRCATCGGNLEVLAGGLEAPLTAAARTSDGEVLCADACNDYTGVVVESHGRTVSAGQGETATNGPLTLRVTQNATRACVRCRCDEPSYPASGLFVSADGVFRPGG